MIEMSNNKQLKNITAALIQFHNEVGKVAKNSSNPYFKSKYGDLNAYLEVIKEPLANSKLTIVQMPVTNGLRTILMHESGEYLESECTIPNLPADAQKLGAAITYLRRYMIASFLGLNAEDDDGESMRKSKAEQEKRIKSLRDKVNMVYGKIKNPSDKLKTWVSQLDTHNESQLCAGLIEMEKIIQGENK